MTNTEDAQNDCIPMLTIITNIPMEELWPPNMPNVKFVRTEDIYQDNAGIKMTRKDKAWIKRLIKESGLPNRPRVKIAKIFTEE